MDRIPLDRNLIDYESGDVVTVTYNSDIDVGENPTHMSFRIPVELIWSERAVAAFRNGTLRNKMDKYLRGKGVVGQTDSQKYLYIMVSERLARKEWQIRAYWNNIVYDAVFGLSIRR